MIKVRNLIKKYRSGDSELVVLKGIDLDVKGGEFLAITGRSGSGKSTLLYQLGLLDYPNSGSIHIGDLDTAQLSPDERTTFRLNDLGYVFQDYALVPELTALENVTLPLIMQSLPIKEAESIGIKVLERVGLGHRLNNLPSKLSGGEQQRVSIARAIGHNPKIIFADEPTANLDSETSRTILDLFLGLHKEGQTIVMVTHEPEYTVLADRVITLSDGRLI